MRVYLRGRISPVGAEVSVLKEVFRYNRNDGNSFPYIGMWVTSRDGYRKIKYLGPWESELRKMFPREA